MTKILLALAVFIALTSCVTVAPAIPPTPTVSPCDVAQVKTTSQQLQKIFDRWQDALKIADSTGRGALSVPVSDLQSVRRDAKDIGVPECLDNAKKNLIDSMDAIIEGFLAFMAQKPDSTVNSYFTTAKTYLSTFNDELERVKACAPDCP